MNVEVRREARRRRILENSQVRLKKITSIISNPSIINEESEFIKDKPGKKKLFSCLRFKQFFLINSFLLFYA